jgi:ParB family chromosome partitioning protein
MKTALGRGLDALITDKGQEIIQIELKRINPGEEQPRKVFRDDALKELAASIKQKGVLQPVLVNRKKDGSFSLIAGERRVRASKIAGLKRIPAIVKNLDPEDTLEVSLIENIQREDLGPIETAQAFQRLLKQFGLTQEKLSEKVGKERATVANYLRLLKLPQEIRKLLNDGELSMGHARAILSADGKQGQMALAKKIVKKGLSVREAERLVKKKASDLNVKKGSALSGRDPNIASLEEKLIKNLGTKVRIKHRGKRGQIEIEYYSLDELDRLLEVLL